MEALCYTLETNMTYINYNKRENQQQNICYFELN